MRVAVIGGTGLVGTAAVEALTARGHEAVVVARSTGVDVLTGEGLDAALAGADAVIDATNTASFDAAQTRAFFGTATGQLLAAEQRAGVGHHVLLSIVGIERVPANGHYAGKLRQEEVALAGPIAVTILRATQFHDFAGMVAGWTRDGDVATVPPLHVQPVAVAEVADTLAELATSAPLNATVELAGPRREDLADMARRTLAARNDDAQVISRPDSPFAAGVSDGELLPGPGARLGTVTFDEWLAEQDPQS